MHYLDRTAAPRPPCLDEYTYPAQNWGNVNDCKPAIRSALIVIQGERCAYCEGPLFDGRHIEHFRRKNPAHFPELTFEWTNLFLSCQSQRHCGHFKDRPGAPQYNPDDLIKPDVDDPDEFFYFYSTGEVRVRNNMVGVQGGPAVETIRVFGLDDPALVGRRRKAVAPWKRQMEPDMNELSSWPAGDRHQYLSDELAAVADLPYATTIRHFLERVL